LIPFFCRTGSESGANLKRPGGWLNDERNLSVFTRGCPVQVKSIADDASIRSVLALSHIVNDLADFMNAQAFHVWFARHIVFLDQA